MSEGKAMSERTRKFVMEITQNGSSPPDAAKLVGLPPAAAPALMANQAVKREIDTALGVQGLDQVYFASKMRELCEATNSKGDPDWGARSKGLTMLKDIFGYEAPKQVNQTTTVVTYEERLLMLANEDAAANTEQITEITVC